MTALIIVTIPFLCIIILAKGLIGALPHVKKPVPTFKQNRRHHPSLKHHGLLPLLILLLTSIALATRLEAQTPPAPKTLITHQPPRALSDVQVADLNVHQYFIPFDDRNLITLLRTSNRCQNPESGDLVGDYLASRVSLTASSDGTVYYYDHWEDDYDVDPLEPASSTEIGTLDAGESRTFVDEVNTANLIREPPLYYDGRDRITIIGEPAVVIRAAFPSLIDSTIGSRLAGAWEVKRAIDWGTDYIVPAGEDWGTGSDFEFTGASIMAFENDTQIFINGALSDTLDQGETCFVNGTFESFGGPGLNSGDTITATHPIQVHTYSSICAVEQQGIWSGNGYTLEPVDQWSSEYWSPVPNRVTGSDCKYTSDVDIFLYNPNPEHSIDVYVDDGETYTLNDIPPETSISVAEEISPARLSSVNSVHIFAAEGDPFWGIVNVDTRGTAHEWGYSLVPQQKQCSQVIVGWGPGSNYPNPPAWSLPSGNLAWVTSVSGIAHVYVDLDQDGTADLVDCNGDGDTDDTMPICVEPNSNLGITLPQGKMVRIADPGDADMTGALIYTQDLTEKIAVVWGQDSCIAEPRWPYLDLGYTVSSITLPCIAKSDALARDTDRSTDVTPDDLLTYAITITNNSRGTLSDVVLTETLPYTFTDFVVGSLSSDIPTRTEEYDDGSGAFTYTPCPTGPWNVDPAVRQLRLAWAQILPQQSAGVAFRVHIQTDVPTGVREISNVALVASAETPPRQSKDPTDPKDPDTDTPIHHPHLAISKQANTNTANPGERVTYTIVVSNTGTANAPVSLTDYLPSGMDYVPNTLDLTWPIARIVSHSRPISYTIGQFAETYGDNFDNLAHDYTTGFGGNDGTLIWKDDWREINDDALPTTGDVRVPLTSTYANSEPSYLFIFDTDDQDSGTTRCADLSAFAEPHLSFQLRSRLEETDPDDFYRVTITSTLAPTPTNVIREVFNNQDSYYVPRERSLRDYAGHNHVCISFFGEGGLENSPITYTDYLRFDDIFIYEASTARYETRQWTTTNYSVSYSTATDIDPLYSITRSLYVTEGFLLPPLHSLTCSFQAQAAAPLTDGLKLTNTACVGATNWPTTCADAPVQIVGPGLLMTKTLLSHSPTVVGEWVRFQIRLENTGSTVLSSLSLTDTYDPLYLAYQEANPPPTDNGDGVVNWEVITGDDRLTVGDCKLVTVTFTAMSPTHHLTGDVTTNLARASATDENGLDLLSLDDDAGVEIGAPGLALTKTLLTRNPALLSDTVQFVIEATNTGSTIFATLLLTDTFDPHYLAFEESIPPPDEHSEGGIIKWTNLISSTPFAWGDQAVVTVTFTAISPTHLSTNNSTLNRAQISALDQNGHPSTLAEDESELDITTASYELAKRLATPDSVSLGSIAQFQITITNTGRMTITHLPLTETFNTAYLSYQDAEPCPNHDTNAGILYWKDLSTTKGLTPGASTRVEVNFETVSSTQRLTESATTNVAICDGVLAGPFALPRQRDAAKVTINGNIYLPIVIKNWPTPVATPELRPITPPANDNNYTVEWNAIQSSHAITYVLRQDQVCDCDTINPGDVYAGTATSFSVNNQRLGRYCYTVRACSEWICSAWSNRECVDALNERSSNDDTAQADGPLCLDTTYSGVPEDEWDWFKICLDDEAKVTVDLGNYTDGSVRDVQFKLWQTANDDCDDYKTTPISSDDPDHYRLECTLPQGQYFVSLLTNQNHSDSPTFTITVSVDPIPCITQGPYTSTRHEPSRSTKTNER